MASARIYTYSVLFSSSKEFEDKVPYVSAILETPEGSRFASLLVGYKPDMEICVGQEVREIGQGENGMPIFSF
ncbi:MAG: OB-fold domain-containing protein [Candidatus Accumulibacter sp.]|jgi:uncharacterized OB-fold protein|nr:OB-fold domain-containing protein [Accumulibacter sp.]